VTVAEWPKSVEALVEAQKALAEQTPPPWRPSEEPAVGACFVCFERGPSGPGRKGEPGWAGAAIVEARRVVATATVTGAAGAAYEPGLLALREGPLLEAAVRALSDRPAVLLVDATGRDHPRRAGLALHLGAVLDLPTVGVTHRPLLAAGEWPTDERGATSPLELDGTVVGCWLRTRQGTRPLAVHAGWRTDPPTAVRVVTATLGATRTPEPLRVARRTARAARAGLVRGAAPHGAAPR
jgi:deoxyribonuclease V